MKRKIYAILTVGLLLGSASVFAQKDNVGIGTTSPDASAVLDIQSSNKGLLIPRMSSEQMRTINSPAAGLMVYQTGEKAGFYFYNGKDWKPLTDATEDAKSIALDADNWSKNGDAVNGTNFIGTTNDQSLKFRVNNQNAGSINRVGSNTFFGYVAGNGATGTNNVGIGFEVLYNNASGSSNVGIGFQALKLNTGGANNLALGNTALSSNSSGNGNVAIGTASMSSNNTGNNNTAIGAAALNKLAGLNIFNVAVGASSMFDKTSGSNNVGVGFSSLRTNLSGSNNTSIGHEAGRNATGSNNVLVGYNAGFSETGNNKLYISNTNSANPLIKGDFTANNVQVNSKTTGYLAIGDFTTATSASPGTGGLPLPANIGQASGYRLVVQDGILCEKVKVALRATGSTDWADYVFEPEYKAKMLSLEEVEKYINTNKHLPNVPSTAEVQKEGLDFHQTSRMFMEKIEELTLYMIDMKKEINALKAENEALKAKK
ncbi:hypothetical protein MCERE19_02404 [Spirosomataceae bacterium]